MLPLLVALIGSDAPPQAQAAFCRAVLPLSDMARDSARAGLYRRVMAHYQGVWTDWRAQASPADAAEVEAAVAASDYRTASRQTKNMYAQSCVEASGVKAQAQIVE